MVANRSRAGADIADGTSEEEGSEENKTTRASVMVGMPAELRVMVENAAKEKDQSLGGFIRQLVAQSVGYTGELTRGRASSFKGTPEERKEMLAKRNKERRDLFKALLAKYDRGEITL